MELNQIIAQNLVRNRLRESKINTPLARCMSQLYKSHGPMNGGECATVAYYAARILEDVGTQFEFSGTVTEGIVDGEVLEGLSHIMIKCGGIYYDATNDTGIANVRGEKVVDNLECIEKGRGSIIASIGNEKYGYIDCYKSELKEEIEKYYFL